MQINYILGVHRLPGQVERLISQLHAPGVRFFIHVDMGTDIVPFRERLDKAADVTLIPDRDRVHARWDSFGIVEMILTLIRYAYRSGKNDSFVILLSGQDYPLKSPDKIARFLSKNHENDFISGQPIEQMSHKLYWYSGYHLQILQNGTVREVEFRLFQFFNKIVWKDLVRCALYRPREIPMMPAFLFLPRKAPACLKLYTGELWWVLRHSTVGLFFDFLEQYPEVSHYFRYVLTPDEAFFHSVLYSIPEVRQNLCNSSLRYIDWSQSLRHPRTFTMQDKTILQKQMEIPSCLFARKFDQNIDAAILDEIDRQIAINEQQAASV